VEASLACGSDANTSRGCQQVNMLRERSKSYGDGIKFVDICADDYAPEENSNIDFETVKLPSLLICHQVMLISLRSWRPVFFFFFFFRFFSRRSNM
jgi:hypothetical protein